MQLLFPEQPEQLPQPLALAPLPAGGRELLDPLAVVGDVGRHGGGGEGGGEQEGGEGEGRRSHHQGPFLDSFRSATHALTLLSSRASGNWPWPRSWSWKARRSNRGPSSFRAQARSSLIFSSPIL